jgi:hypothetical protein
MTAEVGAEFSSLKSQQSMTLSRFGRLVGRRSGPDLAGGNAKSAVATSVNGHGMVRASSDLLSAAGVVTSDEPRLPGLGGLPPLGDVKADAVLEIGRGSASDMLEFDSMEKEEMAGEEVRALHPTVEG